MLTINNTLDGYLKDVEIKGNTIQDSENLADIRSVGDKVEGQELYEIPVLSCNERYSHVVTSDDSRVDFVFNEFLVSGVTVVNKSDKLIRPVLLNENGSFVRDEVINAGCTYVIPYGNKVKKISLFAHQGWIMSNEYVMDDIMSIEGAEKDKLTILSPVQLEKVGDVADRIIEKDGVWGVEKNVVVDVLDDKNFSYNIHTSNTNVDLLLMNKQGYHSQKVNAPHCILEGFKTSPNGFRDDISYINLVYENPANTVLILDKGLDLTTAKQRVLGKKIYRILANPQFIPLPHDQQIKLRTFANKTNISFLTEIEGTIKAQVPKSIGATVNTHTEQISNLNKELDRVKKLEESTVSTVETESDFTTVEATSNGYFEDVKLEGKTLVNCLKLDEDWFNTETTLETSSTTLVGLSHYNKEFDLSLLKDNTTYTVIPFVDYTVVTQGEFYIQLNTEINGVSTSLFRIYENMFNKPSLITTKELTNKNSKNLFIGGKTCSYKVRSVKILILEGDHTQNPPSYFEGLKSVGQSATTSEDTTDEIVVSSVNNGNILKNEEFELGALTWAQGEFFDCSTQVRTKNFIPVAKGMRLKRNFQCAIFAYDKNKKFVKHLEILNTYFDTDVVIPNGVTYIKVVSKSGLLDYSTFYLGVSLENNNLSYKQDKKRLLYYNNENQSWEKPVLREWDSIEKHSDGKYYYHQRSGEVVLNGSEDYILLNSNENTSIFKLSQRLPIFRDCYTLDTITKNILNNKFHVVSQNNIINTKVEGISHYEDVLFGVLKSKLSTQDTQGFKAWLQANNVTVVYKLAQEKVYECTNIDLITYANETNYIVESGAIVPKTTLKVHNNISNVVSLLQKKVSLLESNITSYIITQNRLQLASTYSADSVTFKVDYFAKKSVNSYDNDLFNLILSNILVGKENYDYDKMFNIIMDYASWSQISWDQFDILVEMMDLQHNPPIELPTEEFPEETPEE